MYQTLISTLTFLSISSSSAEAFDAWDVLSADISCCPQHATQSLCDLEGGSDCMWIADSENSFEAALALHDGVGCVGSSYLACKTLAQDVTACCAPGCTGESPPSDKDTLSHPAQGVIPECFQLPSEELESCELGVNYAFEGVACQISGDPHTTMFNSDRHDFQGQPTTENVLGKLQNQFYYVARCVDAPTTLMPFQILGTHFHWGDRPVSGIDYFTIELEEEVVGSKYFIYISSDIAAWAEKTNGVTSDYDATRITASHKLNNLVHGQGVVIGSRFEFTYIQQEENKISARLSVISNEDDQAYQGTFSFTMQGQMGKVEHLGSFRYRMHYVFMEQDSAYKCASCGLCGNFKDSNTYQEYGNLELCDGKYAQFRSGWDKSRTPEAYDLFGWTYESTFFNRYCGETYDIANNYDNMVYVNPCDQTIVDEVKAKCDAVAASHSVCCKETIGGDLCQNAVGDCYFDACVIATDNGATSAAIEEAVLSVLGDAIVAACAIPNVGAAVDAGNLINRQYLGCYNDKSHRAFQGAVDWDIPDMDIAACVDFCSEGGFSYMGLQWTSECFCSNDYDAVIGYGAVEDDSKCAGEGNWCTAGWVNCVYRISTIADKYKYIKKSFMSEIDGDQNRLLAVGISSSSSSSSSNLDRFKDNYYMQIGAVAGVIIVVGAAVYYKKRKNSGDKYVAINA